MPRDNFSEATKRKLAERVGYKCSNPFCRRTTIGPQNGTNGIASIGEASHICAAAQGGKRYNPEMSPEERKSYENGIWMCRTHAALIDRDENFFTVEMLKKWKVNAEQDAGKELIGEEIIKKCKFRMLIFYNDLIECKKAIEVLSMQRGIAINATLLPVQKDWENHLEEISEDIGPEITATLYKILREVDEFKIAMQQIEMETNGRRMANMNTVKYSGRYDIFMERMSELLTDDLMDAVKFYTELI